MKKYLFNIFNILIITFVLASEINGASLSDIYTLILEYSSAKYFNNNKSRNYIENKIVDEAVDYLALIFTLNSTIEKLPQKERENLLRQKAWLLNIRRRIINKLKDIINKPNLSEEYRFRLNGSLQKISKAFDLIDNLKEENIYEKEYKDPSWFDKIIENNIIESILSCFKPDPECTQKELQKKQEATKRIFNIISKLKNKVEYNRSERITISDSINYFIKQLDELFSTSL